MTLTARPVSNTDSRQTLPGPDENLVLQMLSVRHVPTTVGQLLAYMEGLAPRENRRAWTADALRAVLSDLEGRGWVSQGTEGYACRAEVREVAARAALRENRMGVLLRQARRTTVGSSYLPAVVRRPRSGLSRDPVPPRERLLMELRHAMYEAAEREIRAVMDRVASALKWDGLVDCLWTVCMQPFDGAWLERLPGGLPDWIASELALEALLKSDPATELFAWMRPRVARRGADDGLRAFLGERLLLEGKLGEVEALLDEPTSAAAMGLRGWAALLRGDDAAAIRHYRDGVGLLCQTVGRAGTVYSSMCGPYYVVSLLRMGDLKGVSDYLRNARFDFDNAQAPTYQLLASLVEVLRAPMASAPPPLAASQARHPAQLLVEALAVSWIRHDAAEHYADRLREALAAAERCGYRWLEAELSALLGRLTGSDALAARGASMHEALGTRSLLDAVATAQPWRRTLDAVEAMLAPVGETDSETRLVWMVGLDEARQSVSLEVKEQRRGAKGWTSGRSLSNGYRMRNRSEA